jgi:hypothetical protein
MQRCATNLLTKGLSQKAILPFSFLNIVTDLSDALSGNGSVNTFPSATMEAVSQLKIGEEGPAAHHNFKPVSL